ncbi:MAG: hypothetical protein M3Q55_02820 [Acidobacteriota bacterium]|nr:hypothetical protein [Acidobacteriota bacterium]
MTRVLRMVGITLGLLMAPAFVWAQSACPEGRPQTGDLGIAELNCDGGPCAIYGRDSRGLYHRLSIEPRLTGVDSRGPSARLVRENDVLVAVDQRLVTTPEGGRRLAQLNANQPVELWLRRNDQDVKVTVTPRAGCGFLLLTVRDEKEGG